MKTQYLKPVYVKPNGCLTFRKGYGKTQYTYVGRVAEVVKGEIQEVCMAPNYLGKHSLTHGGVVKARVSK